MGRVKADDGQAIVEFVLILPIFVGLLFAAIGYGITLNNYLRVTDMARVAARAAADARFSGQSDPCAAATAAAQQAASGLSITELVCSPDPDCGPTQTTRIPGDPITICLTIRSQNTLNRVPFLSSALPQTLESDSTVLLQ